jgi:hypothetical protein
MTKSREIIDRSVQRAVTDDDVLVDFDPRFALAMTGDPRLRIFGPKRGIPIGYVNVLENVNNGVEVRMSANAYVKHAWRLRRDGGTEYVGFLVSADEPVAQAVWRRTPCRQCKSFGGLEPRDP